MANLKSHSDIAKYVLGLITAKGLTIPASEAENFVEVKHWLRAIGDGVLYVGDPPTKAE